MRPFAHVALALVLSTALTSPVLAQITPTDPIIAIGADEIPGDFAAAIAEAADAREMFLEGNHAEALTLLRPMADAGNAVAQNIMGIAFTEVNSAYGAYDPELGFAYLLAAGAQNFGPAMHNLGDTYEETHEDFAPNLVESTRWYLAAAELGYVTAYYNAGYALVNGQGVPEDIAAGRVWLERALEGPERGLSLGLLGNLAYFGRGQAVDHEQSLDYYLLSAEAGNAEAAYYAAYQFYWGEGTGVDDAAALPLLEQAVAEQVTGAYAFLALIMSSGIGDIAPDPMRALALATQGDERGNGFASAVLGDFFRRGVGTVVNYDQARAAYSRGAERGEAAALYQLGDMAYFGLGEPENFPRALELYDSTLKVDPDYSSAIYSIAYMQMRGEGTEVDLISATELIERAIASGSSLAMNEAIELFGSPTYAGPQTDEVRAFSMCILSDNGRGPQVETPGDIEDHEATCARLAEELSAEDQATAASMAAAF